MPFTQFDPTLYGDSSASLGGRIRAGDQTIHLADDALRRSIIGDARQLAGHARGGDDDLSNSAVAGATVVGDAESISGHARGGSDVLFAHADEGAYGLGDALSILGHGTGGDDIVSVTGGFEALAYGDALQMSGHARGGQDTVSSERAAVGLAVGDAGEMSGHTRGGDDKVEVTAAHSGRAYGDAVTMTDHARGGDDEVTGQVGGLTVPATTYLFGDADTLSGHAKGGDDTITGQGSRSSTAEIYGDGRALLDHAIGGDDRLVAGIVGDHLMWGDAAVVDATASTGEDTFVFSGGDYHAEVMDFRPGEDRLEFNAIFADFEEFQSYLQPTADGVLISLGPDTSVLVRSVSALAPSDVAFVWV